MHGGRINRGDEMWNFLLGAAVGYVLGSRAGRERYEQLHRTYQRIADHPAVQGAAGVVRARVEETVNGHKHDTHGEGARGRAGAVR
jgi:hypothetical protein